MTNEVLTDAEAQKLFNSVASNLGNPEKLAELMTSPEAPPAPTPASPEVEPATNEVSPEATQETTGNTEEAEAPEGATVDPVEELKALKARYQDLEHRYRSDDGRVSAFQRKVRELESKLAALDPPSTSKPAPPPASSVLDPSEVEAAKELEALKRVDPALYKILVARDAAHKKEIEALKAAVSTELAPVRQTVTTIERDREKARLRELVPNIEEVIASDEFLAYQDTAPAIVKQWLKSKSADDVVEAMKAYAIHLQTSGRYTPAPAAPTANAPAATASPVASERERKLATSVNVNKAPAAPVRKELTDQELFDQVYNQLHKVRNTR